MTAPTKTALSQLSSRRDLATFLGVKYSTMIWAIYKFPDNEKYRTFEIAKKSGGRRVICAPSRPMLELQYPLKRILDELYTPRRCVYGFVAGRSLADNARQHRNKRHVFNVDLEGYFPSIGFSRVYGMFRRRFKCSDEVSAALAKICTHDDELPTGAPTSPVISNMISARLDSELTLLAQTHRCWYTRYADDLTFSTNRKHFPEEIASLNGDFEVQIGPSLETVITTNGFAVNLPKTRLQDFNSRQVVTGLTVNRFPNVDRKYIFRVRAMLHSLRTVGAQQAMAKYRSCHSGKSRAPGRSPKFDDILRGHIEYIGFVRGHSDHWYLKFAREYKELVPAANFGSHWVAEEKRDVFLCHASEDKADIVSKIADECKSRNISCWYDHEEIRCGDGIVRSINRGLSTCRIVLVIVTPSFQKKAWPQRELEAATMREIQDGDMSVLPVFVGSQHEIRLMRRKFPLLATARAIDRSRADAIGNIGEIVDSIVSVRRTAS